MKIYFNAHLTLHIDDHRWAVIFTPAISLERLDRFCDEKAYYFVIQWLVFSAMVIVTRKKQQIPEGECNIYTYTPTEDEVEEFVEELNKYYNKEL